MSKYTIAEMIDRVPEGQSQLFERTVTERDEEHYFRVWQNWDYYPGRLHWLNNPSYEYAPWLGTRNTKRRSLTVMPLPDLVFKGPLKQVVDFYGTGNHAFFISGALFRLIEKIDPGSLEQIEIIIRAKDAELPFHAVMPKRVLEAVDPRRTSVLIEDQDLAGQYFRYVRFPDGITFDNTALEGVATFSDIDAGGWYWSKELIDLAKERGIRGFKAQSVTPKRPRTVARL
jgi:hypothetical protein